MPCQITGRTEGDTFVWVFDGALDTEAANEIQPLVKQSFLGGAKKLVFDLEKVPFVSSMGLGVFATAIKTFPGKVVFAGLQQYVRQTFKLAKFDTIATIARSVDDAMKV
jgi:anti-anti-sigma factor